MNRPGSPPPFDADGEAGFTLVELLVALALFSLLATLLFNNVHAGLQAWRHGSQFAEELTRRANVQDALRRLIGNLYPMAVVDGMGVPRVEFEGTKERISFLAAAPAVAQAAGQFRYDVFVERRSDRADLMLSATPELGDAGDASASTKIVLLPNVAQAEFAYLGDVPSERRQQWLEAWTRRADIPKLVRVQVAFRPGDGRAWPDLLIAPRILADVGCVYDPATKRCRGR